MKNFVTFIFCFLSVPVCYSQVRGSQFIFTLAPQYLLNRQFNLDNDGKAPNPMSAKNVVTSYVEVGFQRLTRFGIVLRGCARFGVQKNSLSINRDLSDFDGDATISLRGLAYSKRIATSTTYIAPHIAVGYRRQLRENWAVVGTVGASIKLFLTEGEQEQREQRVTYSLNANPAIKRETQFQSYNIRLGTNQLADPPFHGKLHTLMFYLGAERAIGYRWIKNVSAGIELERALRWYNTNFVFVTSTPNWATSGTDQSIDRYYDRNVAITLRLGVGFWK